MILKEDIQLYRGIFWITDVNNVQSSKLYFTIPCDNNGDINRVEISNGIAKVFHSPRIPQDDLKQFVIDKFNLSDFNGIKKIKMIADGSEHYRCHLDD